MSSYYVTIIKTVKTVIRVEADSALGARKAVKSYGLIEAASDFPVVLETVNSKLMSVDMA